jgi:HAD superfamily hydrolase (TIGR01509 family)
VPLWHSTTSRLKAILFDVDGTLYDQTRVRLGMLARLLAFTARYPTHGWQSIRIVREFRRAQETLRHRVGVGEDTDLAQAQEAARRLGVSVDEVRRWVMRWMEHEPLDLLSAARRDGVMETLTAARARGIRLGVCSDYPADAKLAAMHLHDLFDVVVCAQDADVQSFKPDPRGLLVATERLHVQPSEALFVGDRPEIDAVAAERAGMASVIVVGRKFSPWDRRPGPARYTCRALAEALTREDL